ncbi:AMP-dependent synthetase/ligase [Streptomyces caatingaensis]|uniref:Acyl-CoA synthetase n=1 Tax=Streptomyces caatingaensis TaxID=1678637 RepID=A0A0K9XL05_9ACTN|nr:long-chain fatty acid--CoA ligase [Streptomyces caatingaensis]KNB54025.1 AMP-dependent synthetase [Streptomyces caatingaensis]
MTASTVCEAFQATVATRPDAVALRTPGDGRTVTWGEYGRRVRRIAAGLAALGVRRGDLVALMLRNRPEFHLADMAVLHVGATPFSVYNTSPAEQLRYLFGHAGATVLITEEAFLDRVRAVRPRTGLRHVVTVDGTAARDVLPLERLEATDEGLDFEASWRAVRPEDLLTVIYTSGTTGPPKGVEITHANQMAMYDAWRRVSSLEAGDTTLSYLPSAHAVDRLLTHYAAVASGAEVVSLADPSQLAPALRQIRPTKFAGVPRVWEKFRTALLAGIAAEPDEARRAAVLAAIETGRARVRAEQAARSGHGPGPDEDLNRRCAAAEEQVFAPLRALLGLDRLRMAAVGAAPSAPAMLEFFAAIGVPVHEGWGMTELSGLVTLNPPDAARIGTVGRALPGIELKLARDGELLVRGPVVTRGYRNAPEKTAELIGADGWLRTGDIATIDDDGYVTIVDRKKELIINAAGKNMSPANIEAALKSADPLIGQCVCVGDRRPYNVALVVLDPDARTAFARAHGLPDTSPAALAADPHLRRAVADAVEQANRTLSHVEQIKRFAVLPVDWLPDSDELTPTMKLKRRAIAEKYADQIDGLYAAGLYEHST